MNDTNGRRLAPFLVLAVAFALTGAGTAGGTGRYTDAAGDGKGSADVTGVSVASDVNGQILFTVSTATHPGADGGVLGLFLDTDVNPASGAPSTLGADFVVAVNADGYDFGRWTGTGWDWNTPYSTVRVLMSASTVSFSVNRSELAAAESINFWVSVARGDTGSGIRDDAPDDGTFNFTLAAGGPDIREVRVRTAPTAPRAGRTFAVAPAGLVLPPAAVTSRDPLPDSYRCVARLGAKALRGQGTGGCSFAIPRKSKGKRLSVALTVEYQGAAKTVQLVYRVR
jgi:hypothetical protein